MGLTPNIFFSSMAGKVGCPSQAATGWVDKFETRTENRKLFRTVDRTLPAWLNCAVFPWSQKKFLPIPAGWVCTCTDAAARLHPNQRKADTHRHPSLLPASPCSMFPSAGLVRATRLHREPDDSVDAPVLRHPCGGVPRSHRWGLVEAFVPSPV